MFQVGCSSCMIKPFWIRKRYYFQERIFGLLEDFDNHESFERNKIWGSVNAGKSYIVLESL